MERINVKYLYAIISLVIILFIILYTDKINLTPNYDDMLGVEAFSSAHSTSTAHKTTHSTSSHARRASSGTGACVIS